MQLKLRSLIIAGALALGLGAQANAAFINIDDTDPNTITIWAGDFEGGFWVDGNLLTMGLGNNASITLPDAGYSIDGSWLTDAQLGSTARLDFAEPGAPTLATSGVEMTVGSPATLAAFSTGGFGAGSIAIGMGSLHGSLGGYSGTPYLVAPGVTYPQGSTQVSGLPYLSIEFKSEVQGVPDTGSSAALLGLALTALGLVARRNRR